MTNIETWIGTASAHIEETTKGKYDFMQKTLGFTKGPKYYRVFIQTKNNPNDTAVYCFIDMDGNIYKAAGWKKPAKGARAHIATTDPSTVSSLSGWLYHV